MVALLAFRAFEYTVGAIDSMQSPNSENTLLAFNSRPTCCVSKNTNFIMTWLNTLVVSFGRGGKTWMLEATIGYTPDGLGAGRGGIATLLSARWVQIVTQLDAMLGNRAQWLKSSGILGRGGGLTLSIFMPQTHMQNDAYFGRPCFASCHATADGSFSATSI